MFCVVPKEKVENQPRAFFLCVEIKRFAHLLPKSFAKVIIEEIMKMEHKRPLV